MRNNEGHVPEAFFKVLLCLNGTPKGIGFVAKNTTGTKKLLFYQSGRAYHRSGLLSTPAR